MKKIIISLFILVVGFGFFTNIPKAKADVYVNGYYRSNGTYVEPYWRSNPDGDPYNNYSFPGNYNPYTGITADGNPDTYLNNYYSRSYDYYPSYNSDYSSSSSYDDSNSSDYSWSDFSYGDY